MGLYIGLDVGFANTGVIEVECTDTILRPIKFKTISYKKKRSDTNTSVAIHDALVAHNLYDELDKFIDVEPTMIFAEIPTGGSRSARAARCMGFST